MHFFLNATLSLKNTSSARDRRLAHNCKTWPTRPDLITLICIRYPGDFAEWHELTDQDTIAPIEGTVVGFHEGKISLNTTKSHLIGIVSSRPVVIGSVRNSGQHGAAVAYCGRLPIRTIGPVRNGDILVASGLNDGLATVLKGSNTSLSLIEIADECGKTQCSGAASMPVQNVGVALVSSRGTNEVLVESVVTPPTMTKATVNALRGASSARYCRGLWQALIICMLVPLMIVGAMMHGADKRSLHRCTNATTSYLFWPPLVNGSKSTTRIDPRRSILARDPSGHGGAGPPASSTSVRQRPCASPRPGCGVAHGKPAFSGARDQAAKLPQARQAPQATAERYRRHLFAWPSQRTRIADCAGGAGDRARARASHAARGARARASAPLVGLARQDYREALPERGVTRKPGCGCRVHALVLAAPLPCLQTRGGLMVIALVGLLGLNQRLDLRLQSARPRSRYSASVCVRAIGV